MREQATLPFHEITPVEPIEDESLFDRWRRFHETNPQVYDAVVEQARLAKSHGATRIGIAFIFERLRWLHMVSTQGDPFLLNNSFRAFYAREVMENEPDLEGIFEVRTQKAGKEDER